MNRIMQPTIRPISAPHGQQTETVYSIRQGGLYHPRKFRMQDAAYRAMPTPVLA